MAKLIKELKKDHEVILAILNKVKELGIGSREGQEKLLSVKNLLLAHIKKEDDQLYKVLNKAAENDSDLKHTIDVFAKDMDNISRVAFEFFSKYINGGSGIEFAKDFGRLYALLGERIRREESIIYARYERLV